ncbi:hypothetical protein BJ742DRAFT_734506 [Cladochytrium replicatum]|nr:hypothetical protein BJ742DRAFT_734506 [Cladochytrium replicatum]
MVHHPHEGCWSIAETHWQNIVLKVSKFRVESGFVMIIRVHQNIVISITEVNFGEELFSFKPVSQIINAGSAKFYQACGPTEQRPAPRVKHSRSWLLSASAEKVEDQLAVEKKTTAECCSNTVAISLSNFARNWGSNVAAAAVCESAATVAVTGANRGDGQKLGMGSSSEGTQRIVVTVEPDNPLPRHKCLVFEGVTNSKIPFCQLQLIMRIILNQGNPKITVSAISVYGEYTSNWVVRKCGSHCVYSFPLRRGCSIPIVVWYKMLLEDGRLNVVRQRSADHFGRNRFVWQYIWTSITGLHTVGVRVSHCVVARLSGAHFKLEAGLRSSIQFGQFRSTVQFCCNIKGAQFFHGLAISFHRFDGGKKLITHGSGVVSNISFLENGFELLGKRERSQKMLPRRSPYKNNHSIADKHHQVNFGGSVIDFLDHFEFGRKRGDFFVDFMPRVLSSSAVLSADLSV